MLDMIKSIAKSLLAALMTEAFVKEMVIFLLEKLAKMTDNTIDDQLVAKVKEALEGKQEEEKA